MFRIIKNTQSKKKKKRKKALTFFHIYITFGATLHFSEIYGRAWFIWLKGKLYSIFRFWDNFYLYEKQSKPYGQLANIPDQVTIPTPEAENILFISSFQFVMNSQYLLSPVLSKCFKERSGENEKRDFSISNWTHWAKVSYFTSGNPNSKRTTAANSYE